VQSCSIKGIPTGTSSLVEGVRHQHAVVGTMSLAACRHHSLLNNGTNMTQRCLPLLGSRVRVIGGVCGRINRNARPVWSNGGIVINLEMLGLLSTWKRSARLAASQPDSCAL
jgi:hypothetical protein